MSTKGPEKFGDPLKGLEVRKGPAGQNLPKGPEGSRAQRDRLSAGPSRTPWEGGSLRE